MLKSSVLFSKVGGAHGRRQGKSGELTVPVSFLPTASHLSSLFVRSTTHRRPKTVDTLNRKCGNVARTGLGAQRVSSIYFSYQIIWISIPSEFHPQWL